MVDIFIIHSTNDEKAINDDVIPVLQGRKGEHGEPGDGICNANILMLDSKARIPVFSSWKTVALKKIRMAQVVIVVLGKDITDPGKADTIGWEVRKAKKLNKYIMIYNLAGLEPADYPEFMKKENDFSHTRVPITRCSTLTEIKERIDKYEKGIYDLFSQTYLNMPPEGRKEKKDALLEQYKMFQKSSEDLVSRRQSVNSFYISVNSALVALLGVVQGVMESSSKAYVMLFMCITGIILDVSWINILNAYGTLNGAKMKVIRLIEEQLPILLYDTEWKVMSDKLNNKKYVSFTNSEKRVPKLFAAVYGILIIVMLVLIFFQLFGGTTTSA